MAIYNIEAPMELAQLAAVVRDSARALRRALDDLGRGNGPEPEAQRRVRDLEHEGDRIYRQALASLFDGAIDPMVVIRWKDVYQGLEDAIDRTRQAMDVLQGMLVKRI